MGKELSEMSKEELWELFPIILKQHNNEYSQWYLLEKGELVNRIGYLNVHRISHIGSTPVNGLISKPTVDILLEIENYCDLKELKRNLKEAGWILMSEGNKPFMSMVYNKGYTKEGFAERVFHLHIRYADDWDELYFRDYLKRNQTVADEYGKLKQKLQKKYEHDRDGYTNAKTDFIKKYTAIAKCEMQGKYIPKSKRKSG